MSISLLLGSSISPNISETFALVCPKNASPFLWRNAPYTMRCKVVCCTFHLRQQQNKLNAPALLLHMLRNRMTLLRPAETYIGVCTLWRATCRLLPRLLSTYTAEVARDHMDMPRAVRGLCGTVPRPLMLCQG